mmetsp:Transcript_86774/g.248963  ORF Transcript_86774/g.248963 Transcript_86774/m.248963 type:complete len:359 (+) Transcript_86774:220-1296(+)
MCKTRWRRSKPGREERLGLPTSIMQCELCVAVRRLPAVEYQPERCLKGNVVVQIGAHGAVGVVAGILLVDHFRHLCKGAAKLRLRHETVVQPIRQQLRGDAERGPVLHEADVLQVRHLRAANPKVNPADYIAEDALRTLAEFLLDVVPVGHHLQQRGRKDKVQRCGWARGQLHLALGHVDAMVVDAVKGSRSGRWDPSGARTCHGLSDLRLQHGLHAVRPGPHALTDLRLARKARVQPDVDVRVFVGPDPRLLPHVLLAHHGPSQHASVNLVACAVEETCVDEEHPRGGGSDTFAQVDAGAALLVHDAHLDRVPAQAEELLCPAEDHAGECDLARAMHLGLDDVHGAHPAVHNVSGAP